MTAAGPPLHCCIAGGGPAGLMLGLLLARAGVRIQVLEEHADFLRDFRGDTIHPSTLEIVHELGALDELLSLPHQEVPCRALPRLQRLPARLVGIGIRPEHVRVAAAPPSPRGVD